MRLTFRSEKRRRKTGRGNGKGKGNRGKGMQSFLVWRSSGISGKANSAWGGGVREGLLKRGVRDLPLRVKGVSQAETVGRCSQRKEQPIQRQEVSTEPGAGTGSAYGGAREGSGEEEIEQTQCGAYGLCPGVKREGPLEGYAHGNVIVMFTLLTIRIWDI